MAYALQSMLKIRTMREDRAATELTVARKAKAAAEAERERRNAELENYLVTKDERRDKVFDSIMGLAVTRDQIDIAKETVAKIDEEGVIFERALSDAVKVVEEKTQGESRAHARYVGAMKEKSKIEMHRQAWEEEDRKEQEARAELELEDFSGRKLVADDDDSLD